MTDTDQELRSVGLKVTHPRVKIYQLLEDAGTQEHWSAEDIYKHLISQKEEIGLATVYRVLTQFEAAGLVIRHRFENGNSVFELASEEEHDHIVDINSGEVVEFSDPILNSRIVELAQQHGFEVTGRTVHIYGTKKS